MLLCDHLISKRYQKVQSCINLRICRKGFCHPLQPLCSGALYNNWGRGFLYFRSKRHLMNQQIYIIFFYRFHAHQEIKKPTNWTPMSTCTLSCCLKKSKLIDLMSDFMNKFFRLFEERSVTYLFVTIYLHSSLYCCYVCLGILFFNWFVVILVPHLTLTYNRKKIRTMNRKAFFLVSRVKMVFCSS